MAEIDVEKKGEGSRRKKNNWWIIAVIVIVAILVAWIAISDRNNVDTDTPDEPVVLREKSGSRQLM